MIEIDRFDPWRHFIIGIEAFLVLVKRSPRNLGSISEGVWVDHFDHHDTGSILIQKASK
jgi:hypothetical protein